MLILETLEILFSIGQSQAPKLPWFKPRVHSADAQSDRRAAGKYSTWEQKEKKVSPNNSNKLWRSKVDTAQKTKTHSSNSLCSE